MVNKMPVGVEQNSRDKIERIESLLASELAISSSATAAL